MTYQNMTIIITWASSGIGKAVSLALIPYKPKLVIVARRSDKLRETAEELDKANIDFLPIIGDVRNAEDRNKIIDLTLQEFGQIDVLINNAGIGKANLIVEQPEEEIDELLETNVKALIMLTRKIIPIMKKGGGGHIINISSFFALLPVYPFAVYSATKAAVKIFSDCIREEVKNYGISVSTVLPGPYDTEFNAVAGIATGRCLKYEVNPLSKRIVKLIKKPKKNVIQPQIFVLLIKLIRIIPPLKGVITNTIAKMIARERASMKITELRRKNKEKEEITTLTH